MMVDVAGARLGEALMRGVHSLCSPVRNHPQEGQQHTPCTLQVTGTTAIQTVVMARHPDKRPQEQELATKVFLWLQNVNIITYTSLRVLGASWQGIDARVCVILLPASSKFRQEGLQYLPASCSRPSASVYHRPTRFSAEAFSSSGSFSRHLTMARSCSSWAQCLGNIATAEVN